MNYYFRLIFNIAFGLSSFKASGSTLYLAKISDAYFRGEALELTYNLPCGTKKVGLYFKRKSRKSLLVGILVKGSNIICISNETLERESVSYLNFAGVSEIIKASPARFKNDLLQIHAASKFTTRQNSNGSTDFQAHFIPECGKFAGYVASHIGQEIQIGLLESVNKKSRALSCDSKQKVILTTLIKETSERPIRPLFLKSRDLKETYYLKINRIDLESLKQNENGLTLRYMGQCREAPIGLAIKKQGENIYLGFVVANFFNKKCSLPPKWLLYMVKNASLPRHENIYPMANARGLNVSVPKDYSYKNDYHSVLFSYVTNCEFPLATVYANDSFGRVSAGVLSKKLGKCRNRFTTNTVLAANPFFKHTNQKVFPMKLVGDKGI